MEHGQAVSILEALHKDSKFFQGLLAGRDCYPINNRKVSLAKFFREISEALLDVPHQTDLFSDAPKHDEPVLIECPQCHEKQADGGPGQFCITCGVGPMPTNYPLNAKSCVQALNAVLDEAEYFEIDVVRTWSDSELAEAVAWAKKLAEDDDANDPVPAMPLHIKEHLASFDFTAEETQSALCRLIETPIPLETIEEEWTPAERVEAVSWALDAKRNPLKNIPAPEFVQKEWDKIGDNLAAAAADLAEQKANSEAEPEPSATPDKQ